MSSRPRASSISSRTRPTMTRSRPSSGSTPPQPTPLPHHPKTLACNLASFAKFSYIKGPAGDRVPALRRREEENRKKERKMEREEDYPMSEVLRDRFRLSTISIADAEVFNYSSPSNEEKRHGDIGTRGGLHF